MSIRAVLTILAGFALPGCAAASGPPDIRWVGGGSPGDTRMIRFSADGSRFVVAQEGVCVWLSRFGRPLIGAQQEPASYFRGAFDSLYEDFGDISADGRLVAGVGQSGVLRVYDANLRTVVYDGVGKLAGDYWGCRFSPDGSTLYTVGTQGAYAWRLDGSGKTQLTATAAHSVEVLPDGSEVVIGTEGGSVRFYTPQGQLLSSLKPHTAAVLCMRTSEDGTLLASCAFDGSAAITVLANHTLLASRSGFGASLRSCAIAPDNTKVVIGGALPFGLQLLNIGLTPLKSVAKVTNAVVFAPGGSLLAAQGGFMTQYSSELEQVGRIGGEPYGQSVDWTGDSKKLLTCGDAVAILWDAVSGRRIREFNADETTLWDGDVSDDGSLVAVGCNSGSVKVFHTASANQYLTLPLSDSFVRDVEFSPDGRYLAASGRSGFSDGLFRVWRTSDWSIVWTRLFPGGDATNFRFSPDSTRLAIAHGGTELYDAETGELLWRGSSGGADYAFSLNGKFLALRQLNTIQLLTVGTNQSKILGDANFRPWSISMNGNADRIWQAEVVGSLFAWNMATNDYSIPYDQETNATRALRLSPDGLSLAYIRSSGTVLVVRAAFPEGIKVAPASFAVKVGQQNGGNVASVAVRQDGNPLQVTKVEGDGPNPAVEVWFEGQSPTPNPSYLSWRTFAGADGGWGIYYAELWDWQAERWDPVDFGQTSTGLARSLDVRATGDLRRYVSGSGTLRGRVRYVENVFDPHSRQCYIDQAAWFIQE